MKIDLFEIHLVLALIAFNFLKRALLFMNFYCSSRERLLAVFALLRVLRAVLPAMCLQVFSDEFFLTEFAFERDHGARSLLMSEQFGLQHGFLAVEAHFLHEGALLLVISK